MNDTVALWAGEFGDAYTERNNPNWRDRLPFWEHIIDLTNAQSFLDVGTNVGHNLQAIRSINAEYIMSGIDVNRAALDHAQAAGLDVVEGRADQVLELFGPQAANLVVTSGVLIHIAPEDLTPVMQSIIATSSQYVLAVEYDAQEEAVVEYRGHLDKLWRRPYGRLYEALGLSLVEFGERAQGYDQCAWWLLEKS